MHLFAFVFNLVAIYGTLPTSCLLCVCSISTVLFNLLVGIVWIFLMMLHEHYSRATTHSGK
jgi:hypothetical protein